MVTTSVLRLEPELPVSLRQVLLVPLRVLAKLLPADATPRPEPGRASRGRRGYQRQLACERPPDEEPANLRRFQRTEAERCCGRA